MYALLLAAILITPFDWTAETADAPLDDVVVHWWVEDDQGNYLFSLYPFYADDNTGYEVDLSLIPVGTYVCLRGWAYSTEARRRDAQGWYPPGFSSGFAPAEGVCFEVH